MSEKTRKQIAMDCIKEALQAAMDGKKAGIAYTKKQKESVKCHAADPDNCRFHKTGKYANLTDSGAFNYSEQFGQCTTGDMADYLNEAMEAKGFKGYEVSVKEYQNSGTMFIVELKHPDGSDEDTKLEAMSALSQALIAAGIEDSFDIKDELASKKKQYEDLVTKEGIEIPGFLPGEDIVKPDGESSEKEDEDEGGKADAGYEPEEVDGLDPEEVEEPKETEKAQEGEKAKEDPLAATYGDVMNVIADAVEANGGSYEDALWDEYEDGPEPVLTLQADDTLNLDEATIEKALKDAGYANASVYYNNDDNLFEITAGEKAQKPEGEGEKAQGGEAAGGVKAESAGESGAEEDKNDDGEGASQSKKSGVHPEDIGALMKDASIYLPDSGECQELCEEIGDCLADLDYLKGKVEKAKSGKLKEKYQKELDAKEDDIKGLEGEIKKLVDGEKAKIKAESEKKVEAAFGEYKKFLEDENMMGMNPFSIMTAITGDHNKLPGVNFSEEMAELGESVKDLAEYKSMNSAFEKVLDIYKNHLTPSFLNADAAKFGNDVKGFHAEAKNYEHAVKDYIQHVKDLKEKALAVKGALKGKIEAKKAGMDYQLYCDLKAGLMAAGVTKGSSYSHEYEIDQDGHMKVTAKTDASKAASATGSGEKKLGKKATAWFESKGDSNAKKLMDKYGLTKEEALGAVKSALGELEEKHFTDDDACLIKGDTAPFFVNKLSLYAEEAKKKGVASEGEKEPSAPAVPPETGVYSHGKATKEEKGAAIIGKLEKMIAGAKDPAMKAKYEKALAAQKKLHGAAGSGKEGASAPKDEIVELTSGHSAKAVENVMSACTELFSGPDVTYSMLKNAVHKALNEMPHAAGKEGGQISLLNAGAFADLVKKHLGK